MTEIPTTSWGWPQPWKVAPHHVYEMYAADGTCLYVGCTMRLGARLGSHERYSEWWKSTVRLVVTTYEDEASGLAAEKAAIKRLLPRFNVVHTDEHKSRVKRGWDTRRRNEAQRRARGASLSDAKRHEPPPVATPTRLAGATGGPLPFRG